MTSLHSSPSPSSSSSSLGLKRQGQDTQCGDKKKQRGKSASRGDDKGRCPGQREKDGGRNDDSDSSARSKKRKGQREDEEGEEEEEEDSGEVGVTLGREGGDNLSSSPATKKKQRRTKQKSAKELRGAVPVRCNLSGGGKGKTENPSVGGDSRIGSSGKQKPGRGRPPKGKRWCPMRGEYIPDGVSMVPFTSGEEGRVGDGGGPQKVEIVKGAVVLMNFEGEDDCEATVWAITATHVRVRNVGRARVKWTQDVPIGEWESRLVG